MDYPSVIIDFFFLFLLTFFLATLSGLRQYGIIRANVVVMNWPAVRAGVCVFVCRFTIGVRRKIEMHFRLSHNQVSALVASILKRTHIRYRLNSQCEVLTDYHRHLVIRLIFFRKFSPYSYLTSSLHTKPILFSLLV